MRAAALLAAALITGCGLLPGSPPDWVANRLPLPSCGEEELGQGDAGNIEGRLCLFDAYLAGQGAELISTALTIEGDPITRYIRVHESGVVEIFIDASRDRFGSGEWERLRCNGLLSVDEANQAPGFGLPPEMIFVEDDCAPEPVP